MNSKDEDFKYMVEHTCSALSLSHQAVKERYIEFPVCYMQYRKRKDGICSDSVEVSFDRIGASITFTMDAKDICFKSSVYFYEAKDGDLFIAYLVKTAEHYSYKRKIWILEGYFYTEVQEQKNGLHFYFKKL